MQILNIIAITVLFLSIFFSSREFLYNGHKYIKGEDAILIYIAMLSLLNICICVISMNMSLNISVIVKYLVFGSVLHQSILSLFTIHYIKRNKKD